MFKEVQIKENIYLLNEISTIKCYWLAFLINMN